jgi:hypothetical protein
MSDELYFGQITRKHRSLDHPYFYDSREDEIEQYFSSEEYSLNDNPRTRPMTLQKVRLSKRESNPHGD